MRKTFFLSVLLFGLFVIPVKAQFKTRNLILITIDGCRWQDIYNGADSILLFNKQLTHDSAAFVSRYWRKTSAERRSVLLPFLWKTWVENGQLYGNRKLGSYVNVANHMWFSYPGYNEVLCGFPDDERVNSNDLKYNPNKNVLEFLNQTSEFKGKVAAFSSWDAFPYIINEPRSGVLVNSSFEAVTGTHLTESEILMNKLMRKVPEFLGGVRNDAFTFYQGFEYLKKEKPRVLYLALDETDDLAHEGRYDLYLNAIHYTDEMISELWTWIQQNPDYKDKTTLMITVDHGRGTGVNSWRSHGTETPESDQTWFAIMGPDTPTRGEISGGTQIYSKQFAATLAALLGQNYINEHPIGEKISSVTSK